MTLPSIMTREGQKALAFVAVWLGCVVMTLFAAIAVYLVSGNETYSFWLGIAAHGQIALGLAVFAAQFVKRTIKAGKDGLEITDTAEPPTTTATATVTVSNEPLA